MGALDLESHGSDDAASTRDGEMKTRPTHRVPVPNINVPMEEHINSLHTFLTMHALNLQTLQKGQREMSGQRQEIAHKTGDNNG